MRDSATLRTEAGNNGAASPSDTPTTEPNRGAPHADMVYWEMPSREARVTHLQLTSAGACDACRRMKIRCINKENPPCHRCRRNRIPCRFEMGVNKDKGLDKRTDDVTAAHNRDGNGDRGSIREHDDTKDRLDSLESQVSTVVQKLDNLTSVLLQSQENAPSWSQSETPLHTRNIGRLAMAAEMCTPLTLPRTATPAKEPSYGRTATAITPDRANDDCLSATSLPVRLLPQGRPDLPLYENDTNDDDDDDPLAMTMSMEPFRALTRVEQEERLRADGHPAVTGDGDIGGASLEGSSGARPAKRRRTAQDEWGPSPIRELRGPVDSTAADPVTLGLCTEEEGMVLFDAFWKHANGFIPVLDPEVDTWDSLRKRSPFLITVILFVASRAHKAAGTPGHRADLSRQCQELAEQMARLTLFCPVSTLETVQGLVIFASWAENAWRPGCHAMTLAVDMRLYLCLSSLHKIQARARAPNSMLEKQRPLVAGARVWLGVLKLTYEMSYNNALPVPFASPLAESAQYARELLDHPLSNIYDSRCVVTVEMLMTRESLYKPFQPLSSRSPEEIDALLRETNRMIRDNDEYWTDYYVRRGLDADHFLVKELGSQKAYCFIYGNSCAWKGVRTAENALLLSSERRQWLATAVRSAAYLVSSIGSGKQMKDSEFANHYFHLGIVSTAHYLIRACELLPEACDLHQVSVDLDKLLLKLPQYPVEQFSQVLRSALHKARTDGVLPHTSSSVAVHLPGRDFLGTEVLNEDNLAALDTVAMGSMTHIMPGFISFPWNDSIPAVTHPTQPGQDQDEAGWDNMVWLENFNLEAWFPSDS